MIGGLQMGPAAFACARHLVCQPIRQPSPYSERLIGTHWKLELPYRQADL